MITCHCPFCDHVSKQEKRFYEHLKLAHAIEDLEQAYADHFLKGVKQHCECGCGKNVKWSGWKRGYTSKYLRGHNASVDSVFNDVERNKEFAQKRSEGYKQGKYQVWNAGFSKETSDKVCRMAEKTSQTLRTRYASGDLIDWRVQDPEKAAAVARKSSETLSRKYKSGELIPWAKGKTKHTDDRLRAIALSNSAAAQLYSARRHTPEKLVEIFDSSAGSTFELLTDPKSYRNKYQLLDVKCKTCGHVSQKSICHLVATPVCFKCHPKESRAQLEIFEFVRSHAPDAVLSDREVIAPRELDIFVPSRKLAIEYNGLYYHSVEFLDEGYHQSKLDAATAAGVKLIHVFEDEWRDKRPIVESMILHRLGLDREIYDARKLKLVQLPRADAEAFFDGNHLDGHARCKVTLALCSGDDVVAAMSLRRPFHRTHSGKLEVARAATKRGANVRGWLGKLTAAAARYAQQAGVEQLMTYVDSRVGNGSSYAAAGWTHEAVTAPRFWWTDGVDRYDRFKFKADRSRGMSQADVAKEAGVKMLVGTVNSRLVKLTSS